MVPHAQRVRCGLKGGVSRLNPELIGEVYKETFLSENGNRRTVGEASCGGLLMRRGIAKELWLVAPNCWAVLSWLVKKLG